MGLLDELGTSVEGAMGQVLGQALNQVEANAIPAVLAQVTQNTNLGSLNGLIAKLQEGNLGPQVQSWISKGANIPVTGDQIREALGNAQVQQMAKAMGVPEEQALNFLAQHLPSIVDQMKAHGTLPEPKS